jgi:predicted ATPase/class 3 adenylate cyclase
MQDLPTGTVTLLLTDIEGSTRLLNELGERYANILAEHRRLVREAFQSHGGVEVDTQGDALFYAFTKATDAVAAAEKAQRGLSGGPVAVRMGIHTGEPLVTEEGYVGVDVHRAARIMSAGHGGQVLLSEQTARLVGNGNLQELGQHRLKDLTAPERLSQLGHEDFPPLKTLDATNLPYAASPLLGREAELAELVSLLSDGTHLVTVMGPGGTGKTRLALQVAAELVGSLSDGVFWVPLAGLSDSGLVVPTIARTLGARDEIQQHLRDKQLVLLLDNVEHLLAAAPALGELLLTSPGLRLLVTSRAPLHLTGEREYPLDPLPASDASTLFCERARAVGRQLDADATIAAVCARLDGLPLAIELAAARTKLLDPETLLARLEHTLPLLTGGPRDAPERQRTLRATIEWSYDLLDEEAKRLLPRLSVFAGSFSLEAAEEVAEADLDPLAALVDLSLLKPIGESRFLMLETIREYAAERLEKSHEADEFRRGHARFFLRLAEEAEPGTERADVLAALAEDEADLRAALSFCAGGRDPELMLRLAGSLWRFWYARSQYEEGFHWLDEAVKHGGRSASPMRAQALRGLASMADDLGDYDRARALLEEALALYRQLGDDDGVARCLNNLALAVMEGEEDLGRAEVLLKESLAVGKRLAAEGGTAPSVTIPLANLARLAVRRGDFAEGRRIAEETVAAARAERNDLSMTSALLQLAWVAVFEDRFPEAARLAGEALRILRRIGDPLGVATCVVIAALVHASRGHPIEAGQLVGAANTERDRLGVPRAREGSVYERPVIALQEELGKERHAAALAEGNDLSFEDALVLAMEILD